MAIAWPANGATDWNTDMLAYLAVGHNTDGKHKEVYNVKEYGAVGNGTTNDTVAIQAAIDAAEVSGGEVCLPQGDYYVSSLTLGSYVHLKGVGNLTSKLIVNADVDVITTADNAVGWKIQDLYIAPSDDVGANLVNNAIVLGANNYSFEIENVIVDDSTVNSYKFAVGLYIPTGWTATVKRLRVTACTTYALDLRAGTQAVHFDQCDFSGLGLTACASIGGAANCFTACKFQGYPIGLYITGKRNVFICPWFENSYPADDIWCIHLHDAKANTFIGGSYTAHDELSGGYIRVTGASEYNQVINPSFTDTALADLVSLEDSSQFNSFMGGNPRWATIMSAAVGNHYNIESQNATEQVHRYNYGDLTGSWHFGHTIGGIKLSTGLASIATENVSGLFTTMTGGATPFDAYGNIIIKPSNYAERSVEIWTGSTPAQRLKVDDAAITASLPILGTAGASLRWGTGTPEEAVTAPVGSVFLRTDGGANTTLYVKETGVGNTGWAAK